jgi:phosphotransferase system HPr (HPr) family protein
VEATRTVRIPNPAGLHARPCHALVTTAMAFESDVRIACDGVEVNGKSILELMTLCAPCESMLVLRALGHDADAVVAKLAELVEAGFHEMDAK